MLIESSVAESGNRNILPFTADGPVRIDLGVTDISRMFPIPETNMVHALKLPNPNFDAVADYGQIVEYILRSLPESQVVGFTQEITEAAALACNTGALFMVRDLIENWNATAEIYAIPGEAEKIVAYIEESEATRQQRRNEGEWDWQTERQEFRQTQN